MRFYETLYIVHPALQAGRLKDIILDICKLIEDSGGKTLSNDIWGKKKLSYAIDKQKYGTYVLFQYNSNAEQVSSFNTKLDQNANILGYLTSRILESEILESDGTVEDQIQKTISKSDISKDTREASKPVEAESSDSDSKSEEDSSSGIK